MRKYILSLLIGLFTLAVNAEMFSSIRSNGYKVVMLASNQTLENVIYTAIGNSVITNNGVTINGTQITNSSSFNLELAGTASIVSNAYVQTALDASSATNSFHITHDPSGFSGETDNNRTYSFNPTSRVLTIIGQSTVYYEAQILTNFTTCSFPPIGTNAGIWYLSWKRGETLATTTQNVSQTTWSLDDIQCATIYWSGGTSTVSSVPTYIIGEETHGFMPWSCHRRFHLVEGSKWSSGLSFSGSAKVFTNSSGIWMDEDIAHSVDQSSSSRIMYRNSTRTAPVFGPVSTQYVITNGLGGADLMWDDNGTLATAGANLYVNYWIYAVPGSVSDYLVVVGRVADSSLPTVTAETPYDLTGLQPFSESVLLYRITLRNANPPIIAQTTDFRKSGTTGTSYSPTVHSTLTGRDAVDSHPLSAITGYETLLTSTATNTLWVNTTNLVNITSNAIISSIPGPGCVDLGTTTAINISGSNVAYTATPSGVYTIAVSNTAPRYVYSLEVISSSSYTLSAGITLRGTHTITGTNIFTFVPGTGTLWRAFARGL